MRIRQLRNLKLRRLREVRWKSLAALAWVALALQLLIVGRYANSWSAAERSRIELAAKREAFHVAEALDRKVGGMQAMLTALASSPLLQVDDIEGFRRQATQVARELAINIVLRETQHDEQVMHTAIAFGADFVERSPPEVRAARQAAIESGRPQASSIFFGRRVKQYILVVTTPAPKADSPRYYLSAIIPVISLAAVLERSELASSWIVQIVDGSGFAVTRSQQYGASSAPTPSSQRPSASLPSGQYSGTIAATGEPARFFFRRADTTGWLVEVGVPDRVIFASAHWAYGCFAAAAVLSVLAAGAIAYGAAGRTRAGLRALQTTAIVQRKLIGVSPSLFLETASNGMIAIDGAGTIVSIDARIKSMFGYERHEMIGRCIDMLLPERLRARHAEHRQAYGRAPRTRDMGDAMELRGRRKDGSEFPIKVSLNPVSMRDGEFVVATVEDVTVQQQIQERLAAILIERDELRRRLMQAQEHERLRLAQNLHDQTGQAVAAVMMELKALESSAEPNTGSRLRKLHARLDDMGRALHRIAWELRPASIDQVGLVGALTDYVADWSAQFGIAADFHCGTKQADSLGDEVSTTVYRIVQEAMTNIAKHARATAVGVIIDYDGSELWLTVEDNGCGFDHAAAGGADGSWHRGLGLDGIRERLSLLDGRLEIETSAAGTTLFIRIPLEHARMVA